MSTLKNRIRIRTALDPSFEEERMRRFKKLAPHLRIIELFALLDISNKLISKSCSRSTRKNAKITIKKV